MGRRNKPVDVFKHIDMSGGDDTCWPWKLQPGAVSADMRTGVKSSKSKARPYFALGGVRWVVQRLVHKLVTGVELQPHELILHTCDNSMCCNPSHWTIGTHESNMEDMVNKDRHGLTHAEVRKIRVMLHRGLSHMGIAKHIGTSKATVTRIANNQLHTHPDDYPSKEELKKEGRL